jgi:hypothetical protein
MLTIRVQIRHNSNPATVTSLFLWSSTNHNLTELTMKAFHTNKRRTQAKKG